MNTSKMIMDGPGRPARRQQGGMMSAGTDGGRENEGREGKQEQNEEGVAVLLNFNENQREFLPHIFFFSCSLCIFFSPPQDVPLSTTWL